MSATTRPAWADELGRRLDALAADPPTAGRPVEVDLTVRGRDVTVGVAGVERYGCEVTGVSVRGASTGVGGHAGGAPPPPDWPPVRKVAEGVAAKVRYLGEPLSVSEVDSDAGTAIVRSVRVRATPDGGRFEQVVVRRGDVTLTGQHVAPDGGRHPAPLVVTRDTLGRVIDDLVDCSKTR